jgi:hypothetical protein
MKDVAEYFLDRDCVESREFDVSGCGLWLPEIGFQPVGFFLGGIVRSVLGHLGLGSLELFKLFSMNNR